MTLPIENLRLFCCIANSLKDGCLPRIGAANDKDTKTRAERSNNACSALLSSNILCSLEFSVKRRHLSLGCLIGWWKWWRIKIGAEGWVYCLVTRQPKEWRHSLTSCSLRTYWELHLNFIEIPFRELYSPWLKWNFQHIHISRPPTELWCVFKPNLSTTTMKACRFLAGHTSSSIQTINQTGKKRLSEYRTPGWLSPKFCYSPGEDSFESPFELQQR